MSASARAGSFFKRLDDPLVLRRMAGPRAHVGEAELLQKLSDIARVEVDAEPLGDDALEVDPPPAHDAVLLAIRPVSTISANSANCSADRRGLGPSVQLSIRPSGPEALKRWTQSRSVWRSMPPILAAAAVHPVPHRSQRQKPPALVDVLRPPGQRPKLLGRIVLSQSSPLTAWPNPPCHLESSRSRFGNPP